MEDLKQLGMGIESELMKRIRARYKRDCTKRGWVYQEPGWITTSSSGAIVVGNANGELARYKQLVPARRREVLREGPFKERGRKRNRRGSLLVLLEVGDDAV